MPSPLPRLLRRLSPALLLLLFAAAGPRATAQDFSADLGQALETIDGGAALDVTIPAGSPERTAYPLVTYYPRPLLTQVPGKPFRQVDPPPRWPAVWNYPLYVGLGLPRDCFDAVVGFFKHVPLISYGLYVAYEKVPTQAFIRDPRDWHRWDDTANHNDHGYYDGRWGYFPSLHTWHFTFGSKWGARRNAAKNEALQKELNQLNAQIDAQNFREAETLRTARQSALTAIEQGNGAEAVKRMLPARLAYPQDEGIFALYVTALSEYASTSGAPEWVRPVLWQQLNSAQPRALDSTEQLLAKTALQHPTDVGPAEALIYARELQSKQGAALTAAQALAAQHAGDPQSQRLVLETAISAEDKNAATAAWTALQTAQLTDRELIEARLDLLNGRNDAARVKLAPLAKDHPENAYYHYYLGVAEMNRAEQTNSPDAFEAAFHEMEQAALQSPNPALRLRAGKALGYLRGINATIAENPTLFSNEDKTSTTTQK